MCYNSSYPYVPTDKPQLTVILPADDYEWIAEEADQAGVSKGGVLRQALALYRATGGLLGPTRMKMAQQVYAENDDNPVARDGDSIDDPVGIDRLKNNEP